MGSVGLLHFLEVKEVTRRIHVDFALLSRMGRLLKEDLVVWLLQLLGLDKGELLLTLLHRVGPLGKD